jgi:hypothetical protein
MMAPRRLLLVLVVLAVFLALGRPAPLLAAGPQLSATFKVADVRHSGDAVQMTFSFALRSGQPSDLVVEAVKLGNPSASDRPYASFQGGTIPAGKELTGSGHVTVPEKAYKKWKNGEPAALFVRTSGDGGSVVWTRVDATATGSIP